MSNKQTIIVSGGGCGCFGGGFTLVGCIAFYLSWITWHSVGWGILHGLLGAVYIIYWLIYYLPR